MSSSEKLEMFSVGPCENGYQLGYQIGQRFCSIIKSRLERDLILQQQLHPFAQSQPGDQLVRALSDTNRKKFQRYWDELLGMADGADVPVLDIILINFRKEILPFVPKKEASIIEDSSADCSDVLVVSNEMAVVAHNEDANVALIGHTYLIQAHLPNGEFFTAYTYAGELPSCAFGFNSHGMAFTLDSVAPREDEIVTGGIGRNFISRDLLEATSMNDALRRIRSAEVAAGHSYNLIDMSRHKILNAETASCNRVSVHEIGEIPFFHANMYLHLHIPQVQHENSKSRQQRAALLPKQSTNDFLSLLGNMDDTEYPIYMTGPILYTLCTAVFDLDKRTLSIIEGNPKQGKVTHVFHIPSKQSNSQ